MPEALKVSGKWQGLAAGNNWRVFATTKPILMENNMPERQRSMLTHARGTVSFSNFFLYVECKRCGMWQQLSRRKIVHCTCHKLTFLDGKHHARALASKANVRVKQEYFIIFSSIQTREN